MGYLEEKQRQLDMRYLRMASIWAENSYCVQVLIRGTFLEGLTLAIRN